MTHSELSAAESRAAAHGIAISPADRAKIAAVQRAELDRLIGLDAGSTDRSRDGLIDGFNRHYPRVLEFLHGAGDVLMTTAQTLIVAFGIPLTLALLLIVEHQRVYHGIALFEPDASLATFAAAALVILNLVLEFQIHHVELKAGWDSGATRRWSLAILWVDLQYRLGLGDWSARQQSPAARYRRLLNLVTFAIIALALAGSMRAQIESTHGNWIEALGAIVSESSLADMLTWAGGLLFTLAAVLAAQGLSRYVALRCAEILASMNARRIRPDEIAPAERYAAQIDAAAARVVDAIVADKLNRRGGAARPFGSTAHAQEEHASMLTMQDGSAPIVSVNGSGAHRE